VDRAAAPLRRGPPGGDWVGVDMALLGCLALTAWLAWRRQQAVVIFAFTTATLLICDAWFDVTTASGCADTIIAIASALLLQLPLATLLFAMSHHLQYLTLRRAQAAHGILEAPSALHKLPLFGAHRLARAVDGGQDAQAALGQR
jgi:hypothetical protein